MPRFSLRQKILLAAATFALLLCGYSFLSMQLLRSRDQAIEQIFKDNGDSLAYMHGLTGSLEALEGQLDSAANGGRTLDANVIFREEADIQAAVDQESQNVTEVGEGAAAAQLREAWERLKTSLGPQSGAGALRIGSEKNLRPQFRQLRALAWQIAGLNLANSRFKDHGRQVIGVEERLLLGLLLLAGLTSALLFGLWGRSLLRPLLDLSHGVEGMEEGHFDLALPVRSQDEIGQLAAAVNAMAGRLRNYERGNRAKLLRVQRTTQLAIDSFSDPIAVLNAQGQIELSNPVARDAFGLRPGLSLLESHVAALQSVLAPVLSRGEAYEAQDYREAIKWTREGRERDALPRILPVLDEEGKVQGATLVLADVTGLRRMDAMKSGLIATVSHELMNPLTTLRLGTHLILEPQMGPWRPEQEALLKTLREHSERLHSILEELLDLGRLESGDFLRLEVRPAAQLLADALEGAREAFRNAGLHVLEKIEKGLPKVAVDARRIGHVFSNLFDNAIKYSARGAKLEVGASRDGARVKFWVEDAGPGVPREFREQIFERFFRVPGQERGNGVGLGLAIAKELTELHGGLLTLEDSEHGARFSFWLPADLGT